MLYTKILLLNERLRTGEVDLYLVSREWYSFIHTCQLNFSRLVRLRNPFMQSTIYKNGQPVC